MSKKSTKTIAKKVSTPSMLSYGKYLGLGILTGVIAVGSYFAYTNYSLKPNTPNPQVAGISQDQKVSDVVTKLKKILYIEDTKDAEGKEERPAVAAIEDKEKVKKSNPEFYKNAENGDYLVIYKNRVIIYREGENKIMNIIPIAGSSNTPAVPAAAEPKK
jgi:hypothetical protein